MRIVIVGDYFGADGRGAGGVAQVVRIISDGYARLGHDVVILAPRRKGLSKADPHNEPFRVEEFGTRGLPKFLSYFSIDAYLLGVALRRLNPEVVHLHGAAGWGMFVKYPVVFTPHGRLGDDVATRRGRLGKLIAVIINFVERHAAGKFDVITVQQDFIARKLRLPNRVIRVANPVSDLFFSATWSPPLSPTILIVARISREKGILEAVRWFRSALKSMPESTQLIVAGPVADTGYFSECVQAVQGIEERVRFIGSVSTHGVVELIRRCSFLLLPSIHENSPLAITEALAVGAPVLARDVGAAGELIGSAPGCWLYSALEPPPPMVDSLLTLCSSSEVDVLKRKEVAAKSRSDFVVSVLLEQMQLAIERRSK